ncbi:SDR family NAD(P)-dependent oxidoreductase [Bradyrhizobium ottawaense]|uniref:SDR family NAD(P)-dependent oxidoreductase n=1 Tax=Bradyrhizobium ottawaense TaxID=931866 RepID=UPI003833C9BE
MERQFENKTVVITGAGRSIGAATAAAFGARGANVVINFHQTKLEAEDLAEGIAKSGGRAALIEADVTNPKQVTAIIDKAVEEFERIDVLINNVGGLVRLSAVEDITPDLFDQVVYLNARSAVLTTAAAVPHMKKAGGGSIINVSSIAARVGASAGGSLYGASKGFISGFTKSMSKELGSAGIRVNAVSPGFVRTAFHDGFTPPERFEQVLPQIPLGRVASAEDIVGAFLFLADPKLSGYLTGQFIEVNGGMLSP